MYNYFMGKESNLARRKEGNPIVVGFEPRAYELLNRQLDSYRIDFDRIGETIKFIAKAEPVNISYVSESAEYMVVCENGVSLMFSWWDKNTEEPKLLFSNGNIYYISDPEGEHLLRTEKSVDESMEYEVNYMPLSQRIDFYEGQMNYLTIQLDAIDFELFDIMMEKLGELGNFESLVTFMKWFAPILHERNHSEVTVTFRENSDGMDEMIEISDGVVQFYIQENDDETFKVDTYGSWVARVKNMKGWYDAKTKKHRFDEIKEKNYPVVEVGYVTDRINEVIPGMEKILKELVNIVG